MGKKCRYGPSCFVLGPVEFLILIDLTEKFLRGTDVIVKKEWRDQWNGERPDFGTKKDNLF